MVLCGPTAVGKTAAAVELALRIGGEIVCADSRTLYRGMDIGTAKPTPEQRRRVPHHLLDVADPDQTVTLATYRVLAAAALEAIRSRGRVPLLVGGTGLYIRAVVDGFTIPPVPPDPDLRARLEDDERRQPGILHARLREVDPVAAARIHPRNVRRLVRALEVYAHTGRPISELQRADPVGAAVQIGLTMDRAALYRRIEARVREQLERGLVDEVRVLLERGYDPRLPAMQGLGYKEIAAYLRGECTLAEAVARLVRNTRRYARRQWIWFRRDPRIRWLDVDELTPAQVAEAVAAMLQ
ncbi:MAG: tRNA (adenosine(37)-N6)-dimethylallyltransferase MiaA [Armatimonadota bacterium]|nr:tRNA (adenosine(37)-N6)-dimethylallyltransferase MiaA [Armatimonadota bacterium]